MVETCAGQFEIRVAWTEPDGERCEGRWHRRNRARAVALHQLVGFVAATAGDSAQLLAAAGPPTVLIRLAPGVTRA